MPLSERSSYYFTQDLEAAKATLRDYTIVAPTELYPLARVLLQELLGWNWTTLYMHENMYRIRSVCRDDQAAFWFLV